MRARYLLWFAQEHVDFRHAEMQSILSLFNIKIKFIEKPTVNKPYWVVELPDQVSAEKIASRSISLKSCIELWSRAKTKSQLHTNLNSALQNTSKNWIIPPNHSDSSDTHVCPRVLMEPSFAETVSFKIDVETFCKHFSLQEKVEKLEHFSYLPLKGPVKLKNPDVTLSYIEFYGMDPNNIPEQPYDVFFGKWIADGQRDLIKVHSLKNRPFIGNTSMDAQLSLLMSNQAQLAAGHVVLDPFVGSGSLLVAAAHFGAYVWGSDIDYLMVHARSRPTRVGQKVRERDESIRSNMRQYGTESNYLDVIVSDFSLPMWRDDLKFDAIITDPPYGVREPTEKIGIDKDNYTLSDQHIKNHVPSKVEYGLPQLFGDLLSFAAKHLVLGRRLVCWYPLIREDYNEDNLPSHPCLKLVANSEQVLSKLTSRRLLTYEKISDNVPDTPTEVLGHECNFRDKYFNGELTRQQKKDKKAEIKAANLAEKHRRDNLNNIT